MGWDYWTYSWQPAWFIDDILDFMSFEAMATKQSVVELKQRQELNRHA